MASLRLTTPRLLLRPLHRHDVEPVLAYRSRPDVCRYLCGEPQDRRAAEDWVRRAMSQDRLVGPGDDLSLAAELDGRVVGDLLLRWDPGTHRQGEVGFVFHPDVAGHGYATEAVGALLELAFTVVALHRVRGRLDARNAASARVLHRVGMRQEAHLRENEWVGGEWTDELVLAVLRSEWLNRRGPRAHG